MQGTCISYYCISCCSSKIIKVKRKLKNNDLFTSCREQILTMKDDDKQSIINALAAMPSALEADDVTDFCTLAQYYAMKIPSFKIDLYSIMFGEGGDEKCITHALCLPVTAQELVENSVELSSLANASVETVRFFFGRL